MPPGTIAIPLEHFVRDLAVGQTAETIIRNLAHELRQPLSALESIAFYLDLMSDQEDPKVRSQLRKLRQLVQQSDCAVSNAVLTAGVSPLTLSTVNLADLVAECAIDWASEHRLQVGLVRPDRFRLQLLDESQIKLLMRNILSFLRRGSLASIAISATADDAEVIVESQEMQIPDADSLALSAIHKILLQHRGALQIEDGPEDSRRVRFTLPFRF